MPEHRIYMIKYGWAILKESLGLENAKRPSHLRKRGDDDDAMRVAAAVLKQTKNSKEVEMRSSIPPLIFFFTFPNLTIAVTADVVSSSDGK